jgi:hypothetical protein
VIFARSAPNFANEVIALKLHDRRCDLRRALARILPCPVGSDRTGPLLGSAFSAAKVSSEHMCARRSEALDIIDCHRPEKLMFAPTWNAGSTLAR